MITIQTKYGTIYEIDNDGCFLRYNDHKWDHPHDSWKCTGCAELIAFGHLRFYNFESFKRMIKNGEIKTFKNGKPKFTLTDNDHGTDRIHGNINAHGIYHARIE